MAHDCRGLSLATTPTAAQAFDAAVDAFLEYRLAVSHHLDRALGADPTFALGHCFKGYAALALFSRQGRTLAQTSLDHARALAAAATPREQSHVAALSAWAGNDLALACHHWGILIEQYPRDLLALRLHHFASFWLGRCGVLQEVPQAVLPAWDEDTPGFGSLLGMYAFGLEEAGELERAEAMGRLAVAHNAEDLWSVHAVAHVLESDNRLAEGVAWLAYDGADLADRGTLKGHLWWHRCLYLLDLGQWDAALEAFDTLIWTGSPYFADLQNAAALLWRLELLGVDVGQRWDEVATVATANLLDYDLPFTQAHLALALARRDPEALARLQRHLETLVADGGPRADDVAGALLPLLAGLQAFAQGHFAAALEAFQGVGDGQCLGGSRAQRDLFQQLRIAAALKAGHWEQASALLGQRSAQRPHSPVVWRQYLQVLERMADPRAPAARRHLNQLLTSA
ncbi:MAG: tetratricopeptide repeat protein [Candidatus Competibacterales bacterium]